MPKGKGPTPAPRRRMVWRITQSAPQGEMVDLSVAPATGQPAAPPVELDRPGWAMSSFELLHGVKVTEEDPDTVPDDLRDELFGKPG